MKRVALVLALAVLPASASGCASGGQHRASPIFTAAVIGTFAAIAVLAATADDGDTQCDVPTGCLAPPIDPLVH